MRKSTLASFDSEALAAHKLSDAMVISAVEDLHDILAQGHDVATAIDTMRTISPSALRELEMRLGFADWDEHYSRYISPEDAHASPSELEELF